MPDRPVSYVGGVSLHTLPDMTPEPTAYEIKDWVARHHSILPPMDVIEAILDARDALIAERETPPQFVPHVLLPADWAVYYTWTVTVTANDPEPMGDPEALARLFHDTYERLAPEYGYRTREASAVPWEDVPEVNRRLMIATCAHILCVMAADPAPTGDDQ